MISILRGDILRGVVTDRESFMRRASDIRRNMKGFYAISWVNQDGVIIWTARAPEANDPTGFNINKHPVAGPVFRRLKAEHGVRTVTPPLDLKLGGRGFVVLVPVVDVTGATGFLGAVFRIDAIVSDAVGSNITDRYRISIRDGDQPVLQEDTPTGKFGAATSIIRIGERSWTLSLVPRLDLPGVGLQSKRDSVLAVIGFLVAICIAWLLRSVLVRNAELREGESRFRHFGEASSDWFWEMDADLRFSFFSERFEEVTGVPPKALLGKTRRETGIPDVDPEEWDAHLLAIEEHRPFRNFIHPRTKDDGSVVWLAISGRPVFAKDGRFTGYRGTGRDITETWEVEAALNESRSRLNAILDNAPASIYLKDPHGRYVLANKTFLNRYDLDESGVLGRTSREVFAREKIGPHADIDDDVARDGRVKESEQHDVVHTDRVTHTIKFPVFDTDGELTGIGGIETDVTDRKRSEESLVEALEQADLASRAKSEFLANVSHELRTPLNAIIGFSEVVKDEMMGRLGNERYRDYIRDIHSSGEHLLSLINDILDLSKIEAGKYEIEETDIAVDDLVQSTIRLMAKQADSAGLSIELDLQEPLPVLRTDARILKQILLNLLSNSVKFTLAGGTVTVTARETSDSGLSLTVSDTGIGMSKVEIGDAMRPFARGGSAMVRRHEGTGLGLPLVQRFVAGLGARLKVESEPQVGTNISVEFPASKTRRSGPQGADVKALRDVKSRRSDLQENDMSASDTGLPGKAATG